MLVILLIEGLYHPFLRLELLSQLFNGIVGCEDFDPGDGKFALDFRHFLFKL